MIEITYHKGNDVNDALTILADDRDAANGNASHVYKVQGDRGNGVEVFADITFQTGPLQEAGLNGITNEILIAICVDRLRGFQSGPFSCRENALALTKLEEAMHWLNARTKDRVQRGVEGRLAA